MTRPAEPPPATRSTSNNEQAATPARTPSQREASTADRPRSTASTPASTNQAESSRQLDRAVAATPVVQAEPRRQTPARSSVTLSLPPARDASGAESASAQAAFDGDPQSSGTLAPEHGLPLWPWLLAAVALGAGGAFLFWRRHGHGDGHGREAFAGGPQVDAFVPPAAPRLAPPRAAPPRPAPPADTVPAGIVSTRLRPWLDIAFQPIRCIVEEQEVTIEFELDLFNSGSAPAREVLIEASLFNASPTQDEEIGTFFAHPVGEGQRVAVIKPLKRFALRPQLMIPRDQLRVLEAGERRLFVPLIAFNVLYGWGSDKGQSSAAYLVGRDTKADKLAPLRLDLGRRLFRGLGARALPLAVRN